MSNVEFENIDVENGGYWIFSDGSIDKGTYIIVPDGKKEGYAEVMRSYNPDIIDLIIEKFEAIEKDLII